MQVLPRRIPPEGATETGEDPADVLELEHEPGVRAAGPVRYALRLQLVSHELVARGRVAAQLEQQCARCAGWFVRDVVEPDFCEALPVPDLDASVDLTPLLREAILLALSSHPVCRPECKGLCSRCGADLNEGPCRCPPETDVRGWLALDDIELK